MNNQKSIYDNSEAYILFLILILLLLGSEKLFNN